MQPDNSNDYNKRSIVFCHLENQKEIQIVAILSPTATIPIATKDQGIDVTPNVFYISTSYDTAMTSAIDQFNQTILTIITKD